MGNSPPAGFIFNRLYCRDISARKSHNTPKKRDSETQEQHDRGIRPWLSGVMPPVACPRSARGLYYEQWAARPYPHFAVRRFGWLYHRCQFAVCIQFERSDIGQCLLTRGSQVLTILESHITTSCKTPGPRCSGEKAQIVSRGQVTASHARDRDR